MKDLYTLKLGTWTTDQIERVFFGTVDAKGRQGVEFFANYATDTDGAREAYPALTAFMDGQRFRTPRGLDYLSKVTAVSDRNLALLAMQSLFQFHSTMWAEGVWEIVRARRSTAKFIVSDEPVTFFNRRIFPRKCVYPGEIELDRVGTRTLFPLGPDSCLIITHVQLVRDPRANPLCLRENARAYDRTLKDLTRIQFGRELDEDEVLRINFILKARTNRYIAAAKEEWLYPERRISINNWSKLDDDWFLFPNLYKVPFNREVVMGFKTGPAWVQDEYGRRPGHPKFKDKRQSDREWRRHLNARSEWAKKRVGKSVGHIHPFRREDKVADQIMNEYLVQATLIPPPDGEAPAA